jgi:hypothetical protein
VEWWEVTATVVAVAPVEVMLAPLEAVVARA